MGAFRIHIDSMRQRDDGPGIRYLQFLTKEAVPLHGTVASGNDAHTLTCIP